jgi:hypothetical protein
MTAAHASDPHAAQTSAPCTIHTRHDPFSRINQKHHVFPQWLQALVPNTNPLAPTVARETVTVCATGHANVHAAINTYITTRAWPAWARGRQKALATEAIYFCELYRVDLDEARKHLQGGAE